MPEGGPIPIVVRGISGGGPEAPEPARPEVAAPVSLALLGGFRLVDEGQPIRVPFAAQRLLAFLAVHPGPRHRVHVASTLWLDTSEKQALANLRSTVWRTQRCRHELVRSERSQLQLSPAVAVDVDRLVSLARRLPVDATPEPRLAVDLASAADLLPDWYDDWVILARERLRHLRLHVLEALCEKLTTAGQHAEAVEAGLAAVEAEPLRESAQRVLIAAHLSEGNVIEAVRQFETYEKLLFECLGLGPSGKLRALLPTSRHGPPHRKRY